MPNRRQWRLYVACLLVVDMTMLAAAFWASAWLRMRLPALTGSPGIDKERYALVAAALIPGLVIVLFLRRAYARAVLLGGPDEYGRVVSGCTYGTILVAAVSYVYGSGPLVSRSWLLMFWGSAILFVGLGRLALRRLAYALRTHGWFVRRVIIAGANAEGRAIGHQLHGPREHGLEVLGFLDDHTSFGGEGGDLAATWGSILGHPREALAIAARLSADLLVVVPSALSWESQEWLTRLAHTSPGTLELEVRLAPTNQLLSANRIELAPLGFIPLLRLEPLWLGGLDSAVRNAIDRLAAALLLLAVAPAALWCMGLCRLQRRPLFETRPVLGRNGRLVNLRRLAPHSGAHALVHAAPALVSVLAGRVALVGPMPLAGEGKVLPSDLHELLLSMPPGLTGPWRFVPSDAPQLESVMADVWWVQNWTVWRHLYFLFQTGRLVLRTSPDLRGQAPRWMPYGRPRPSAEAAASPHAVWQTLHREPVFAPPIRCDKLD